MQPAPEQTAPHSTQWPDVRLWRVQTRKALIAQRLALEPQLRQQRDAQARGQLASQVDLRRYPGLGFYWPVRGEIDIRPLVLDYLATGGRAALPVVVEQNRPVEFWEWRPEMPMNRGIWNIPIPKERRLIAPDVLIVPLVGFDAANYRLGYGGGYYDRTLASLRSRPYCVGFGYRSAQLASIYPQPHDIPMDLIVADEHSRTG